MGLINYKGKLPIAVVLIWKGEIVPNAVTDRRKNHHYFIANESVTEFTIAADAGGTPLVITRKATASARYFNETLNTYTTSPVSGDLLDKLLAKSAPAGKINLIFTYRTFFDKVLEQATRTDADPHNLANPNDSKSILDTFTHTNAGGVVRIHYKSSTEQIRAVPFKVVDKEIRAGVGGKPPSINLVLELDFLTGVDAKRREAMRKLVAMDWSKLVRHGSALDRVSKGWWDNVFAYLANHSDTTRGETLRQAIVSRHRTKAPEFLARDLRNDIDRHLITANHWGEARESMTIERHQRLISDLFGTLHQSAWYASPVAYIRRFQRELHLPLLEVVRLALLYGAGHCGEHAQTSFSILQDIISSPGSKVSHAVYTGNANIDHQFVLYNLDVKKVIVTAATAANNSCVAKGSEIPVWNLRDTIAANATKVGYVMDPYLDPSVMKTTAEQLLQALNSPKRKAQGKDTDFLFFGQEHPDSYIEEDMRSRSEAERRALVKNV